MFEQARHLSRMRRDDDVDLVAAHQAIGIAGERVQRVGVEDERHAGALEQRLDERGRARRLTEPRADGNHVGLDLEHAIDRAEVDGARRRFVERLGHVLGRHRRDDRQARARRRNGHEAGARPQRADRREMRRAGPAARSGDDQDAAEIALVRVGGARRHDLAHPLARQQLEMRPFELVEERQRNADVGNHEIAGVRIGRRKHQRDLRRARA